MKTILLITARFDPQADLLIAELRRRQVSFVRWNTYEFPLDSVLTYRASKGGFDAEIVSDGRLLDLKTVGSVWWQWDQPAGFPEDMTGATRKFAETEARLAVGGLMTVGDYVWINHPTRERIADSKPAQLFAARKVGFEIPPTVISNDPEEVRRFVANSSTPVVYKASSQPRYVEPGMVLFTGEVTKEKLANVDLIRLTPGIFQERIEKSHELRITVVGPRIFSVKIDSQSRPEARLDWRRTPHDLAYEVVELPSGIESKIRAFMETFGLIYGAFDFIVTPDGRYVFLEINPSGAYMWLESATGLGITAALADALIEPCR